MNKPILATIAGGVAGVVNQIPEDIQTGLIQAITALAVYFITSVFDKVFKKKAK